MEPNEIVSLLYGDRVDIYQGRFKTSYNRLNTTKQFMSGTQELRFARTVPRRIAVGDPGRFPQDVAQPGD
jgi:hypothetical protein